MDIPAATYYEGPSTTYRLPEPEIGCQILTPERLLAAQAALPPNHQVSALYSSIYGGIIVDPRYMVIPFGDHMVHRGHAVFDTATVINERVYRLDAHLARFYRSIRKAQINAPFKSHHHVKEIILKTCAASRQKNAFVRYWLSAGCNDFNIVPTQGVPSFWVAVFDASQVIGRPLQGVSEVTVSSDHIPMKPGILATAKTTNYLLNALCAMHSSRFGGQLGIWIDSGAHVAEASIASILVVTRNGHVVVPAFDGQILEGITLQRVYDLLLERLSDTKSAVSHNNFLPPSLSHITTVEQRTIALSELLDAAELLSLSGDVVVRAIVRLDNQPIGDGCIGPFAQWLHRELHHEGAFGTRWVDPIPYEGYGKSLENHFAKACIKRCSIEGTTKEALNVE